MTGRPVLWAVVPPVVAFVIDREVGRALEVKAAAMRSHHPEVAHELLVAVAQLRESGRQYAATRSGGSGSQASGGSAEVPEARGGSGSEGPPGGLTTQEVATRLGISDRQVRNLIAEERLVATRGRRGYVVDEESVALEQDRRTRSTQ